jgi:hypothetical protein
VTQRLLCKEAVEDIARGLSDAAVISDYAVALLSDTNVTRCVNIRVIGSMPQRPHIGALVTDRLSPPDRSALLRVLLQDVGRNPVVCDALKSKHGFVMMADVREGLHARRKPWTREPGN